MSHVALAVFVPDRVPGFAPSATVHEYDTLAVPAVASVALGTTTPSPPATVQVRPSMPTASVMSTVTSCQSFGLVTVISPVSVHAVSAGVPRVTSTV